MIKSAIVIVIDRLGTTCLGPYGNTWLDTPNFNALAARSTLLENCFADTPDLTAAYGSYFSGRHTLQPVVTGGGADLLEQIRSTGATASLVTDDPQVARLPQLESLDENRLVECEQPTLSADELAGTGLAKLFAEAIAAIERQQGPFLMWIHARGLAAKWDAPMAFRQSLAAEDDPDPLESIDVPSRRLAENFDPDELLGMTQACAAQVMVLDECLGVLMDAITQHPNYGELLTLVTSPRGFPLGEHRVVGDHEAALYGELLHVPCFLWRGDGQGALLRQQALSQSPDIAPTLLDWMGVAPLTTSNFGRSLLPLTGGESFDEQTTKWWPRDRVLSVGAASRSIGHERAIRTHAWFLRQPRRDDGRRPGEELTELYRKPEDRWEVNELARRCRHIVEQLTDVMDADEQSLRGGEPVAADPLAEELAEGTD